MPTPYILLIKYHSKFYEIYKTWGEKKLFLSFFKKKTLHKHVNAIHVNHSTPSYFFLFIYIEYMNSNLDLKKMLNKKIIKTIFSYT